MPLFFHNEDHHFVLPNQGLSELWIQKLIEKENCELGNVNVVFTSNAYLLKINQDYLNHHYNTDVITFNYNEGSVISGDIFVSVDQVEINAKRFAVPLNEEINRVVIHGFLHLLGYNDIDDESQAEMTKMENTALAMLEELTNG